LDKHCLFLDLDTGDGWLWKPWLKLPIWKDGWLWGTNSMWDDLLPLVRMEAQRLGSMYPLGSKAIIKRSDDGWHLIFPEARLTKEEEETIMLMSKGSRGHIHFSCLIHDTTLRVSPKPLKNSHEPYLVEIMELN